MGFYLFLLFTLVPATELYFLFKASDYIGGWNTIMVILLTGIWGAYFAKAQGRKIFFNIQQQTQRGALPADDLLHGLLIFVGGILLVTPGFFTDALGFSLIFPVTRWLWFHFVKAYFVKKLKSGAFQFYSQKGFYSSTYDSSSSSPRDVTPPSDNIKDLNRPSDES